MGIVSKTNAQNIDTLTYLRNIVANKNQYIGHPFHELADTMQLQIRFFSPFGAVHHNKNKETSTSFSFYFPLNDSDFYLSFPKLEIYWQPQLDAVQSWILFRNNNGGGWSPDVLNFYSNGIIADIKVRE